MPNMQATDRLIVAIDRSDRDEIVRLADALHGAAGVLRACALDSTLVLGVTILTSLDDAELQRIGFHGTPLDNAIRLAKLAQTSGLRGVVASPHEVAAIRDACGNAMRIVVPGIRPKGSDAGDQRRTMTPAAAIAAGADYIVVGRPITDAADPRSAALAIAESFA
jgi:orotidine-5'-phosphate decarboxylase